MIFLLIIVAWIVVMSLVTGLCVAARVGDVELLTRARASQPGQAQSLAWEPAQHVEVSARAGARSARAEADSSLFQSGGVAA
jgi:hypothetical protein